MRFIHSIVYLTDVSLSICLTSKMLLSPVSPAVLRVSIPKIHISDILKFSKESIQVLPYHRTLNGLTIRHVFCSAVQLSSVPLFFIDSLHFSFLMSLEALSQSSDFDLRQEHRRVPIFSKGQSSVWPFPGEQSSRVQTSNQARSEGDIRWFYQLTELASLIWPRFRKNKATRTLTWIT